MIENNGSDDHIRPQRLTDFIGQDDLRDNLDVFIQAARGRGNAMDHALFYGNPVWVRQLLHGSSHPSWS